MRINNVATLNFNSYGIFKRDVDIDGLLILSFYRDEDYKYDAYWYERQFCGQTIDWRHAGICSIINAHKQGWGEDEY